MQAAHTEKSQVLLADHFFPDPHRATSYGIINDQVITTVSIVHCAQGAPVFRLHYRPFQFVSGIDVRANEVYIDLIPPQIDICRPSHR